MLVDSHCHLDFPEFCEDLDGVLARAAAADVGIMVTIATRLDSFPPVLALAERYANVWCSVGVHPHEAASYSDLTARTLTDLARHPRVVGIGETGLDFHYDHSPRDVQRQVFRTHIAAARESGLPLIVHTREADDETASILAEEMEKGTFRGLIHCFSGGPELAANALSLGFYVSVSGIVTFNKAEELRRTVASVPLDRLLVETDAPFLAPTPHRGRRNEPAYVAQTAARLGALTGLGCEAIAAATTANFLRLFDKVTP